MNVVAMLSSYPNLNQRDWLWKQTPNYFGVWNNIQMLANATNPDWLLLYQYDFPLPSYRGNSLIKLLPSKTTKKFKQEASIPQIFSKISQEKTIYLLREPPLPEVIERNQYNYQIASQYCSYVSAPDINAPHPNYMPAIWYINKSFRELDSLNIPKKIKLCSWITSGVSRTANHRQRLAFLQILQEHNINFDLYGRDLPPWSNNLGVINNKWHATAPYYYNLAIENYAANELYVSEKLWDALLSWCLPIYYGGTAADKLLPSGSFLRLPSLDEKGVAYIQEVTRTPDAWLAAKNNIAAARKIILYELNLLNWLDNFVTLR